MNVEYRKSQNEKQAPNLNMKILQCDKNRLINEVRMLAGVVRSFKINNTIFSPSQLEYLSSKFEYLNSNLPEAFKNIIDDPTLPIDMLESMINTVFDIGEKKISVESGTRSVSEKLHSRYTNNIKP